MATESSSMTAVAVGFGLKCKSSLNFSPHMAKQYSRKVRELNIPIPYGVIAAKAWGDEQGIPVLALHGWLDNAGSFDRLIPLLSPSLYVIAFDAPGHGLSSHKPPGCYYVDTEVLIDIKRIVHHLKWQKFNIIGHSLGGALAMFYASVFPEDVTSVVLIDFVKPFAREPKHLPHITRKAIDDFLQFESKRCSPPPVYSYEKARERLIEALYNEVTKESADILLKRSCKPSESGDGVVFTRDIRAKVNQNLHRFTHGSAKAYMARVKCDLLMILAETSKAYGIFDDKYEEYIDIYKENCKSLKIVNVEGSHFVHLNNPENVAPHINEFFKVHSHL